MMHTKMRLAEILVFAVSAGLLAASQADAQASPSAYTTGYRYDAVHRLVGTILPDPDGTGPLAYAATRNSYDAAGRLIRVERGELGTWQSDSVAPTNWSTFTVLETTTIAYDSQSRKIQETLSGSGAQTVTQYSYDAQGNLQCTAIRMNPTGVLPASACTQTSPTPAAGPDRITKNIYDAADELIQVRNGVGTGLERAEATYSYTSTGKKQYIVDGNGNLARLDYDGHDRLSQWTFPSPTRPTAYNDSTPANALSSAGGLNGPDYEQYTYDNEGNRTSLRKRDGRVLGYSYDGLNRVTHHGGPIADRDYTYDAQGHQLTATFSTGGQGITNTYNGFGELASTTSTMGGTARTISYLYDADGNRIRITHPDGAYFTTAYDTLDRPNSASWTTGAGTTHFLTIAYDSLERRSSITPGPSANASTTYGYDGASRLSSLAQNFAAGTGNLTQTYAYNPASEIATETRNNDSYAWRGSVSVNRPYTTNGLNQYTAAGAASFTYDANGNLTSDGSNNYGYSAENELQSVSGAHNATLSYDPVGRLWQVSSASGTTQFLYDGQHEALEYDANGAILWRYFFGPGADEPVIADLDGRLDCNNTRFLHLDSRGSMIATNDCSGTIATIATYDEYGIPASGNWGRFQYTGQAWIPEVGMYYYKARFYSPTLGRFMQTDPVGYRGGINIYEYALDDPTNKMDPSGLVTTDDKDMATEVINKMKEAAASLSQQTGTHMVNPEAKALNSLVKVLGKVGVANGFSMTFHPSAQQVASVGGSGATSYSERSGSGENIVFIPKNIHFGMNEYAARLGHEVENGITTDLEGQPHTWRGFYSHELRATAVSTWITSGLGIRIPGLPNLGDLGYGQKVRDHAAFDATVDCDLDGTC